MEDVLEKINQTPGVEASLIVGKDGLLITSLGDAEPDPDFLGAETAELLQAQILHHYQPDTPLRDLWY